MVEVEKRFCTVLPEDASLFKNFSKRRAKLTPIVHDFFKTCLDKDFSFNF